MLKGTLDDFTLPDMFRLMSFSKKTGRLDVSVAQVTATFSFAKVRSTTRSRA